MLWVSPFIALLAPPLLPFLPKFTGPQSMHLELLLLGWFLSLILSAFLLQVGTFEKNQVVGWRCVIFCCGSSYTGSSANQAVSSTLQQSLYSADGVIEPWALGRALQSQQY
jgi:hypothetical protein